MIDGGQHGHTGLEEADGEPEEELERGAAREDKVQLPATRPR
jgi:hypothetical protein